MFCDIKHLLDDPSVLQIMAYSQYEHSLERAAKQAQAYSKNPAQQFYGWMEDGTVLGACGFLVHEDKLEITSIAVAEAARGRGIGNAMVDALRERTPALPIDAETDDDAIGFYRKCGFSATAIQKYGVRRWMCTLPIEETL